MATWVNWPSNHTTNAVNMFRPGSLAELVGIVQEAERLGLGVRAVGTGWSNSDVAVTDGYVVETDALTADLTDVLSTSLNASGTAMQLVHVEAGIKLNVLIHRVFARNLELKTLGGSSGQSLAGAVSTSVHGMDVDRGPLPDMVRAIHLVGPGGVQHWIEPSSRVITDRAALKNALGLTDENIHYDDDWFYSVLVSMGSLGIIYSLIIEVDARYALREKRENIKWGDIKARLAGGVNNPLDSNRGVQVVLNPYHQSGDGNRGCYLTTRNEVPPTGLTVPDDDGWIAKTFTGLLISNFQANYASIDDGVNGLMSLMQRPRDIKAWAHHLVGGPDPGPNKGLTVEFMFDAGSTRYLDFVDAALEILQNAYYDERPWLAYLGWISMRFQGRSRAYLSPQQFDRTCSIEFVAVWRTRNLTAPVEWTATPTLLARIEAKGREFGGIQHWGLNNELNANDVARAYPRLDTWRRVRRELTKSGTIRTFDSAFTRRCGLSVFVNLSGFVTDFPGSGGARVVYRGQDGHVWELYLPRSTAAWSSANLTANYGGAPAAGDLAGFVTDFPGPGGARVVYCGQDGHVWELYLPRPGAAWSSADLTANYGGAPAAGDLAGFVTDFPGSGGARVVYCGQDGHVWELYLPRPGAAWSSADLTANYGGAPAAGDLAGFVTDFPGSGGARVVYCGQDGHVWELYLPRSTAAWSSADLTANYGGAPAAGDLAGFVTDFPGSGGARVVYRGQDGHVWELYLPRSTAAWSSADLTANYGGAPAAGDLAGFVTDFPGPGGARVVYCGQDGHVWELYLPRPGAAWSSADLTANYGGAPAAGDLAGFVTDFPGPGGARVVYRGQDGHVWELYLPRPGAAWSSADLTALSS